MGDGQVSLASEHQHASALANLAIEQDSAAEQDAHHRSRMGMMLLDDTDLIDISNKTTPIATPATVPKLGAPIVPRLDLSQLAPPSGYTTEHDEARRELSIEPRSFSASSLPLSGRPFGEAAEASRSFLTLDEVHARQANKITDALTSRYCTVS